MVLSRALFAILAVCAVGGCKQSLFDNHGGDDATGDGGNGDGSGIDGMVQSSCGADCLGDAAADFNGTRMRYLEDHRNRVWSAMTLGAEGYVGVNAANIITTCMHKPTAAACTALAGALLVSTGGTSGSADPGVSWTATANQVIKLTIRVKMPAGASGHRVAVYRNAREDKLYDAPAGADALVETSFEVDALAGDRFYVVFEPLSTTGAIDIGLHFYVNGTTTTFPSKCQLGLQFSAAAAATTVDNLCGADVTFQDYTTGAIAPALGTGAFADLGMAADIPLNQYYESASVILRAGDTTTQLWMRHDAFDPSYNAFPFSDIDLINATGGGLEIYLKDQGGVKIGAETCTDGNTLASVYAESTYPDDHLWHFVRVVHTGGVVNLCLDGAKIASYVLPAGAMQSTYHPYMGRNVVWNPSGAFWDGGIDDVRVITGALPCE